MARTIIKNVDNRLLAMMFGPETRTERIDIVPLILEIYGDEMAHGEEALRLMDDLMGWMEHTYGWDFIELGESFLQARMQAEAAAA
jgi:hypothetical protein